MQANYKQRLRLWFGKEGPARYISHLDLSRTFERALIRAQIPISYSQGFNPRPKMQFANALPLGFTSEGEIVDIWLKQSQNPEETLVALAAKMAPGIWVNSIVEVNLSSPALQMITRQAGYTVFLPNAFQLELIEKRVSLLLEKSTIPSVRRDKDYDLRPLVTELGVNKRTLDVVELAMVLVLEPGRMGRPDDVLKALEIDPLTVRIHRTEIVLLDSEDDD